MLINSVGERDYSAQEVCHLLLQLPLFRASRDFIVLSLDGSRAVEDHLTDDQPATALSTLDYYKGRPDSPHFRDMTLLQFTQQHTMPKELGSTLIMRSKSVVVIVRPYCPPDPGSGPKYEQYCRQKLMLHVPFRRQEELQGEHSTYAAAFAAFLHSGSIPSSLEDDIYCLDQLAQATAEERNEVMCVVGMSISGRLALIRLEVISSKFVFCELFDRVILMSIRMFIQPELWRNGC